jgi:hypothetical protein
MFLMGYHIAENWVCQSQKAEMQGRIETLYALEALKAVVPGFENAKLRNFGMTLGCRDSRKIIGRYSLTEHDVKAEGCVFQFIGVFL